MPENTNGQPVQQQAVSEAAVALSNMRFVFECNRPPEQIGALALVAIAEQLAVLNQHLETMAVDVGYYVAKQF